MIGARASLTSRARALASAGLPGAKLAVAVAVAVILAVTALSCDAAPEPEPPEELAVTQLTYVTTVDWEGAEQRDGERLITTDLGYTVGLSSWQQSITNIELVSCELGFRHLGHEHDVSQLELQWSEDLLALDSTRELGGAPGNGAPYCGLYQIMGTVPTAGSEQELVSRLTGWYQAPGSTQRHAFEATNHVPLAMLPSLEQSGRWDPALGPQEGRVELVWRPARAFESLALDELSDLDLAFSAAQNLGWDLEIVWSIGGPA